MKWRPIYILMCGLILAGIVHIAIILLIPFLGSRDAAQQISQNSRVGAFQLIEDGRQVGISDRDPFFHLAVCRYDLEQTALIVSGMKSSTFWSASVFDERGRVIYSLNDRTAIKNRLQLIVLNPIQMADLREHQPDDIETSIIVEARSNRGFVLLRVLNRDESWRTKTAEFLGAATCSPYQTR